MRPVQYCSPRASSSRITPARARLILLISPTVSKATNSNIGLSGPRKLLIFREDVPLRTLKSSMPNEVPGVGVPWLVHTGILKRTLLSFSVGLLSFSRAEGEISKNQTRIGDKKKIRWILFNWNHSDSTDFIGSVNCLSSASTILQCVGK